MFLFYIIQSGQINIEIEDIDILVYSIVIVQTLCEFVNLLCRDRIKKQKILIASIVINETNSICFHNLAFN